MTNKTSLRVRMMASFTLLVGLLLTAAYWGSYLVFSNVVRSQLDERLFSVARPVIADESDPPAEPLEDDITRLNIPQEYFALFDSSGHLLQQSINLSGHGLELAKVHLIFTHAAFHSFKHSELGNLRMVSVPFQRAKATYVLVVAMPTEEIERELFSFRMMILALLPISLLITALVSISYVDHSLRPISELTRHALDMTAKIDSADCTEIWTPLSIKNPNDELGRLAQAFNQLFEKINSAVGQLRQFVTDASHELRTPLTVLQGETELLLSKPRSEQEYRSALTTIYGELNTIVRIVRGLFTLSLADAGQLRLGREFLYLNEVLHESCAFAEPLAKAKQIAIVRELNGDVPFTGDETFLRQLFVTFLDNAIKYSPQSSKIRVSLSAESGSAVIQFEDSGLGIADEHLSGIFQRFNRGGQTGSAEGQGGGLGLPIAQAIARAHGGSVTCQSTSGKGSVFTVALPFRHGEHPQRQELASD